jgi:hypothetical protein
MYINGSTLFDGGRLIARNSKGNVQVVFNIWDTNESGPYGGYNYAIYRMWNATSQAFDQEKNLAQFWQCWQLFLLRA